MKRLVAAMPVLAVDSSSRRRAAPSDALLSSSTRASLPASIARARALAYRYRLIPVCPETMGGLATPRPAVERHADGHVVNDDGVDVTDAFERGARATVELAQTASVVEAVLKARSPSCGDEGVTT